MGVVLKVLMFFHLQDDMIDNYSKELKACKGELMKQSLRIRCNFVDIIVL